MTHPDAHVSRPLTIATPRCALVSLLTIAIGLAADQWLDLPGQLAVSLWVWALFLWLAIRAQARERRLMFRCLVIATAGELCCALVWQFYDYRLGNVPLFVPPGHVLMLLSAVALSRGLTPKWTWRLAGVALAGSCVAMVLTKDCLSVVFLLAAALLWRQAPSHRPVFTVMLFLALALELYGSTLGNWQWRLVSPLLDLKTHNPPWLSSVMYCLLDWLTLSPVSPAALLPGWLLGRLPALPTALQQVWPARRGSNPRPTA